MTFDHGPSWGNRFGLAPLTNKQSNLDGTLTDSAEGAPAGRWVADPFDAASGQPDRVRFEEAPPAADVAPPTWAGWFM